MHTEKIHYQEGSTEFEGYLAYEGGANEKRPGVLVGHAWGGRDGFTEEKTCELAKLGYAAFAWDVYGKGNQPTNIDQKKECMQPFLDNRALLRDRLFLALNTFTALPMVNAHSLGAIGFCFGGLSVLDLARAGAPIKGVVSFHGALDAAHSIPNQVIQSKILVLHGHEDPMIPPQAVLDFEKEMTDSKVEDWQIHLFSNSYHAFMFPSENRPDLGLAYNARSAARAWKMMQNFLLEILN